MVIMQANYDAILSWPLKLKITFNLLNQLSSENSHTVSFWSKTTSSSFQHPTTDMNIAYGISKFFPLNVFQQNKDQFVRDDALFIKVETDFLTKMPEISLNVHANELLNDKEYTSTTDDNLCFKICHADTT
ncbi:unnamed protein product, partial [Rotaria sordida]